MNFKFILPFFFIALFCTTALFAQNVVNVNPLTGAANVVIPIANYQRGTIKFPISLVYANSGIRPTDIEGSAGLGFKLETSQVSRLVRGLPDDCQMDIVGSTRTGWMYNTMQSTINTFSINNTGTPNCTNEQHDITNINSSFSYTSDTEPDLFYVSAPGLSCQLIFDQTSGKFKPVEYQDLQITYGTATDHEINSFTIINNEGTKYSFSAPESAYKRDSSSVAPSYFINDYNQYRNGIIYYDQWFLTGITDVNGNSVQINYSNASAARGSQDSVKLYIGGSSTASLQYIVYQSVTQKLISSIVLAADEDGNLPNETLTFNWQTTFSSNTYCISSITGNNRNLQFTYTTIPYFRPDSSTYKRFFLTAFSDAGCTTPSAYTFAYAATTFNRTYLPDSSSTQLDYWGYYTTSATTGKLLPAVYASSTSTAYPSYLIKASPSNSHYNYSLTGANRQVDTSVIYDGSLTQITNAQGGTTTITYESNDYYDPSAGATVKGGGIRVKQLTDYDGISVSHNIVRNYSYINPSGNSSGKPVTLPQFAFTIPYSGSATGLTLWTDATALSAYDLSTEDHTIMYEYEKESISGAGSTLSQFFVPATAWDASAAPDCSGCATEWRPTVNLVARPTCVSYGPAASQPTAYPFIPNPNYDFERGLPRAIKAFNSSNDTVSVRNFTYSRSSAPDTIPAFKYDDNKSGSLYIRGYNKYKVYYNTSELLTQQTSKTYGSSPTLSQVNLDTVNLTYESNYFKLKTRQIKNSDGSQITQNYAYVKDYSIASAGTSGYIAALYNLQQQNINWPVESYSTVTRGATTTTTHAALTLYSPFTTSGVTFYRPTQQLNWVQANGASFTPFSVNTTTQTIKYDSLYFPAANYTAYDYAGVLLTADDANKHVNSLFYDHITNQAVATFTNAAFAEVWYSDFDSDVYGMLGHYTDSGNLGTTTDRNGKSARILASGKYISYGLTKNLKAAKYVFSAWLNSSGAGTVTITFTPTTGSVKTLTIVLAGATSGWKYFEAKKVDVSGMTGSITVNVSANATISIDDILCYPENTEASTFAFDPVQFYKICQTNTNGVSAYYSYDKWGRLLYAYDQDRNILKKNTYVNQSDVKAFNTLVLSATGIGGPINTNNKVQLATNVPDTCFTSEYTYTWSYGDGTPPVKTTTPNAPPHLYTMPATYTATLTVSSPALGQRVITKSVIVAAGPNTNLSYTNNTTADGTPTSIAFYNGSTLVASFTPSQLLAGTAQIAKASYTMKITMASGSQKYPYPVSPPGPNGYTSILESGDNTTGSCQEYSSTNAYSFTINLGSCNNLLISVSTADQCAQ